MGPRQELVEHKADFGDLQEHADHGVKEGFFSHHKLVDLELLLKGEVENGVCVVEQA